MSYFIYFPGDAVVPTLYGEQNNQKGYKFYAPSTFGNSQYSVQDYQSIYSQQEFMVAQPVVVGGGGIEGQLPRERKKRERNAEKEIESAKKNGESNIVNHFFSFFSSREKSEKTLDFCIDSLNKDESQKEKLVHLFYNSIQVLNVRRGRKYVNRNIFKTLFDPEEMANTIPQIKEKIQKINGITISELCQVFRKCCYSFYRTYSIDSVLTSKRISCVAKYEHFRKRRKVIKALYDSE